MERRKKGEVKTDGLFRNSADSPPAKKEQFYYSALATAYPRREDIAAAASLYIIWREKGREEV